MSDTPLGATYPRSRYISRSVRRKLVAEARGRCCVSRELLVPGERRLKKLAKLLNKHHIVFFANGGEHIESNLIIVCPNCHALIHSAPQEFTAERLLAAKRHWAGMRAVLPERLEHPSVQDCEPALVVDTPVVLETLNLRYIVAVAAIVTIGDLSTFVAEKIIVPLGRYDGNVAWMHPERVALTLASKPDRIIRPSRSVGDVVVQSGDALAVLVHTWMQAAPGEFLSLDAEPGTPTQGQPYVITAHVRPDCHVRVSVKGTDGYTQDIMRPAGHSGVLKIPIPGARAGTVDTVLAETATGRVSLTLLFLL